MCEPASSLWVGGQSTLVNVHITHQNLATLLERGKPIGGSLITVELPWPLSTGWDLHFLTVVGEPFEYLIGIEKWRDSSMARVHGSSPIYTECLL